MFNCAGSTCGDVPWCGKDGYGVTEAKLDMTKYSRDPKPAVSFSDRLEAVKAETLKEKAPRVAEAPSDGKEEQEAPQAHVDLSALGIAEVTLEFPDQQPEVSNAPALQPLSASELAALGISEVVVPTVGASFEARIAEDELEKKFKEEEEEAAEIAAAEAETARLAAEEAVRQKKALVEAAELAKELGQPGRVRDEKEDDVAKGASVIEAAKQKAYREEAQKARQEFLDNHGFDGIDDLQPGRCCWKQRTPLHLAAASGNVDMVRHLIDGKADVTTRDSWGMTPLDTARWSLRRSNEVLSVLRGPQPPH